MCQEPLAARGTSAAWPSGARCDFERAGAQLLVGKHGARPLGIDANLWRVSLSHGARRGPERGFGERIAEIARRQAPDALVDDADERALLIRGQLRGDPMFSASQRIWGYETPDGSFAQFCRVQDHQLMERPKHLTWEEAACYTLTRSVSTILRQRDLEFRLGFLVF